MKSRKALSVTLFTAMASIALLGAASASATALYNGATKLGAGSTVDFSLSSRTQQTNTAGTETLGECSGSTLRGKIISAGGAGAAVAIAIEELTWTGCAVPTATDSKGGLEITQIGASTEGTVKASSEIKWTVNSIIFGTCAYGFKAGTDLGSVKTSSSGKAEWSMVAVVTKLAGSNFACPETTRMTAIYASTEPVNLRVEGS